MGFSFFKNFFFLTLLPGFTLAHTSIELSDQATIKFGTYEVRTAHLSENRAPKFTNHLINEDSPYLLQHAHNPINWYSWSGEAFEKAKLENKIIFLSIGYATCHWCHVMEDESFDNLAISSLMNGNFVAIKVDREVHPDVDATFMNISRLTTGVAGWPLNVFLTPDGNAFRTHTYIDKDELLSILPQVASLWENYPSQIVASANDNSNMVQQTRTTQNKLAKGEFGPSITQLAIKNIKDKFDVFDGGFGESTKFPQESLLLFLINEQFSNPSNDKLEILTKSLDAMAQGGFYDVVAGGFHRYAIGGDWRIPHFEKMLYNQALLSKVYTRAYQLTKNPLYKRISTRTLDYVINVLKDKNGGFYSATDADSDGREGAYFIWSINELKSVLTKSEFITLSKWLDLSDNVYFDDKKIIRFSDDSKNHSRTSQPLDSILYKLNSHRLLRPSPLTDNKILLSWNSLLVSALLEAGRTFDQPKYLMSGINTLNYLYSTLNSNNELKRMIINNKVSKLAIFEDYVYLTNALLDAYDQNYQPQWLSRAEKLVSQMNAYFLDKENFGYHMATQDNRLSASIKQLRDNAILSPNGMAYQVLLRLYNRTGKQEYVDHARQLINAYSYIIKTNPESYTSFLQGFNYWKYGESGDVQYAYDGNIQIHSAYDNGSILIKIRLRPGWHINSHYPIQSGLIGTNITNLNDDNWDLHGISFPKGNLKKLSFSNNKVLVYENQVIVSGKLTSKTNNPTKINLQLHIQACSDRVCMPPTKVALNIN